MTSDEVLTKVRAILVESLGSEESEVTPEASISADLGAESIDFLDIVFRLEKTFGIKINRGELFPSDILENAEYLQDGRLTQTGLSELRKRLPFLNLDKFEQNPAVKDFQMMLTVDDICRFVIHKLATAAPAA